LLTADNLGLLAAGVGIPVAVVASGIFSALRDRRRVPASANRDEPRGPYVQQALCKTVHVSLEKRLDRFEQQLDRIEDKLDRK
jgi:hypothetical protein